MGELAWHGRLSDGDDPLRRLEAEEERERIEQAIRGLPPRQQQVITLRDVEGWGAAEVCNLLQLSEANQRVLLHRARTRVRDALKPTSPP